MYGENGSMFSLKQISQSTTNLLFQCNCKIINTHIFVFSAENIHPNTSNQYMVTNVDATSPYTRSTSSNNLQR